MGSGGAFSCGGCGYRSAKWLGRCPSCGAWDAMTEEAVAHPRIDASPAGACALPYPEVPLADASRLGTGIDELDRVLGGGLVPGAVILVGGEPGIGKSTLLLQAASSMAEAGRRVLYATGEESAPQLRLRGDRLGVRSPELRVLAETDVGAVLARAAEESPAALVIDSIQSCRCADLPSLPGSVAQVRESAGRLVGLAKSTNTPVLLVGHVTKDGAIAGPRLLEHMVDTVLHFEGDRHLAHRLLRALKNRFGPADELAVFTMGESGLRGVASPSELFLAERPTGAPGSAILAAMRGSRPLLIEIQALVGEPTQATPRRTALGVDPNRLAMLLAVLERRVGLAVACRDVFVNVAGGLEVDEPAGDLAVAAAVASSACGRALRDRCAVLGEIGLTGEVRAVARLDARLREADRLGFDAAVVPDTRLPAPLPGRIRPFPVRHVAQALEALLGPRPRPAIVEGF